MTRTVLVLAALSTLGATCCGDWDEADVEIAEIEDIKVPWFDCQIDPLTGAQVDPDCEPPPPVEVELPVQIVDAGTGSGLCGVDVHARGFEEEEIRVLETPLISDDDGRVTFVVEVMTFFDHQAGTDVESSVLLTAGDHQLVVVVYPG